MKKIFSNKIKNGHLIKHETKRQVLIKFILLISIFAVYFIFVTQKYGTQQGLLVTILTWSFFVLCTPIADAGFLIDFPIRLLTNIKMLFSEIIVWVIAISINSYIFLFHKGVYSKTMLLTLFKNILEKPFPFWSIIFLSMLGTFVSIRFGDELLDKTKHHERDFYKKHKNNHKFIIMFFIFILTFIIYESLLKKLGVNINI